MFLTINLYTCQDRLKLNVVFSFQTTFVIGIIGCMRHNLLSNRFFLSFCFANMLCWYFYLNLLVQEMHKLHVKKRCLGRDWRCSASMI